MNTYQSELNDLMVKAIENNDRTKIIDLFEAGADPQTNACMYCWALKNKENVLIRRSLKVWGGDLDFCRGEIE